jgi:hypothetical protein
MMRKHFYVENSCCVICDDEPNESLLHLFFSCDFSQNFWWRLGYEWNTNLALIDMLKDGKHRHGGICFKEILIIGTWNLWNHRNRIIFDNEDRSLETCYGMFKEYFALVMHRAKPSLKEGMQQWIDNL